MNKKQLGTKGYPIPVIDLFAGPGGLGEGFSRAGNESWFKVALSIEMDPNAHKTLLLRAIQRLFQVGERIPDDLIDLIRGNPGLDDLKAKFPDEYELASNEALCLQLGRDNDQIHEKIEGALGDRVDGGQWILIGGPPCQAYSLAGRARKSRQKKHGTYIPEQDHRHYLYQEYLQIIAKYKPAVFVMENVKGLLSAKVNGESMFERIVDDLVHPTAVVGMGKGPEYSLHAFGMSPKAISSKFSSAKQFVIESERFGVPQKRHRVIIVGIRSDFSRKPERFGLDPVKVFTCSEAIGDLPRLRSRLSTGTDGAPDWARAVKSANWRETLGLSAKGPVNGKWKPFIDEARSVAKRLPGGRGNTATAGGMVVPRTLPAPELPLANWYDAEKSDYIFNHEARSHMVSDLHRYFFVSIMAKVNGESPKLTHFPESLLPNHKNAKESARTKRLFADRFRVQLSDHPSTTVTSHISKDGHGFIHYDPAQCRSLTVREAARLQTFPDDYCFLGSRTAQFHQVGNAVPPYLAYRLAEGIARTMGITE